MLGLLIFVLLFTGSNQTPQLTPKRKHLFVDNYLLAQMSPNLHFHTHLPTKHPTPVITPEHPWEQGIYLYSSVVQVSTMEARLYYTCSGVEEPLTTFLCVALSNDAGLTWSKPMLDIHTYNGSKTNIVFSTPYAPHGGDGTGWPNTVFLDSNPECPPEHKWKLTYDTDTKPYTPRLLLVATSADGMHWKRHTFIPNTPVMFGDTQTVLYYSPSLGDYVVFGRNDTGVRAGGEKPARRKPWGPECGHGAGRLFRQVGCAVSSGKEITNFGPVQIALSWDEHRVGNCTDFYNSAAMEYEGVHFMFPSATRHLETRTTDPFLKSHGVNDNLLDIRMLVSRHPCSEYRYVDGFRDAFVPRGVGRRNITTGMFDVYGDEWDAGVLFMTTGFLQYPTGIRMFYYGTQQSHTTAAYHTNAQVHDAKKGIGLLNLRLDGFVSLAPTPGTGTGTATTVPLLLPTICTSSCVQLLLNVETSVSGFVQVELRSSNGVPIPGYTFAESVKIVSNSLDVPMVWQHGTNVLPVAKRNKPITIAFQLTQAHLYSFVPFCGCEFYPGT